MIAKSPRSSLRWRNAASATSISGKAVPPSPVARLSESNSPPSSRAAPARTLYLLDEPTTGLHSADIQTLLNVLLRLREAGNTLIVIEHHLDVIRNADWVIDLGPGGGNEGGHIVATGTPEEVMRVSESATGRFLKA
jgi:excinuclease UvrABC ATPase subunit